MTLGCFLLCDFAEVLLGQDEDLYGVFLLGLYAVHDLNLLQSLE